MRRLIRRLADFYGKHAFSIDVALIAAGANAVRRRVIELNDRLEQIENGGMVPRDDLVTLRDLERKVGPVLLAHDRALKDAGLLDVEVVDDGAPEDARGAETVAQEAPGAP